MILTKIVLPKSLSAAYPPPISHLLSISRNLPPQVRTALPCDNFLKKDQRLEDPPASSLDASLTSSFDQAFARGGKNQEKVKKILEKIKKKAESRENKKYKGFGEKVEAAEAKEARRREARERRRVEMTVKKAAVSGAEASLMADLLKIGDCFSRLGSTLAALCSLML